MPFITIASYLLFTIYHPAYIAENKKPSERETFFRMMLEQGALLAV